MNYLDQMGYFGYQQAMGGLQNMGVQDAMDAANMQGQLAMMHDPLAQQRNTTDLYHHIKKAAELRERNRLARFELVDDVASQAPHLLDYCL